MRRSVEHLRPAFGAFGKSLGCLKTLCCRAAANFLQQRGIAEEQRLLECMLNNCDELCWCFRNFLTVALERFLVEAFTEETGQID